MYVVDGEGFEKEKSGVWMDSYLANNLDLKVGDEISFTYQKYKITENATLKVLGFKDKQIKKIFIKQNIWITIIAIIIGLPLGFYKTDYIFKAALGDNYDFSAQIRLISYIYAAIGTFVVSIFVDSKLSKKIKTIDMVSSLKANE